MAAPKKKTNKPEELGVVTNKLTGKKVKQTKAEVSRIIAEGNAEEAGKRDAKLSPEERAIRKRDADEKLAGKLADKAVGAGDEKLAAARKEIRDMPKARAVEYTTGLEGAENKCATTGCKNKVKFEDPDVVCPSCASKEQEAGKFAGLGKFEGQKHFLDFHENRSIRRQALTDSFNSDKNN